MSSKVLLVDDDVNARIILNRVLVKGGYEVQEASNGREALEVVARFKPDVMLVDWMMPEMDGEQLAKWIKNDPTLRFTYIILLTAKGDVKDRVRGLQSGADDYITKPAPHQEVLARVESGMRVRRLHGEIQQLTRRVAVLELAATVGHEINNPLNVIYLALDMMRKSIRQKEYDKLDKGIQLIAETADRLKEIARKFVELKEPESTSYIDNLNMINIHKKDNPD
ncbi:MAG TPA: response regulator [Candidatus Kryptobacter bacterium]|nr:response regulator [Candidatus Kryptobacter bacterium]